MELKPGYAYVGMASSVQKFTMVLYLDI